MSRIDDIDFMISVKHYTPVPQDYNVTELRLKLEEKAKSELLQAVLEVIGGDNEPYPRNPIGTNPDDYMPELSTRDIYENQLKAEQRKRANELFGVEE